MVDKPIIDRSVEQHGAANQLGNISSNLQPTSNTPNDATPAQIHSHT